LISYNQEDYSNEEFLFISSFEKTTWKENFRLGVQILNGWQNLEKINTSLEDNFITDLNLIKKEIYSVLKEHFALPLLRKENFQVESEANTYLQTYLYDFLYEQQDLFDYYDEFLLPEFNPSFESDVIVKNSFLPLADSLKNFSKIFKEMNNQENLKKLSFLRWYNLIPNYENENNKISLTHTLTPLLIAELQNNSNDIIFILNSLFLTIINFCKVSYSYIMIHQNNDVIFLNEYIKRCKSYVEAAIHLNTFLENLNVVVNYSYDLLNQNSHRQPKFSVLRFMIITWNREVLEKINCKDKDFLILEKSMNMYENFLRREIISYSSLSEEFLNNKGIDSKEQENFIGGEYINNNEFDNLSMISGSTNYSNLRSSLNPFASSLTGSLSSTKMESSLNSKFSKMNVEINDDYFTTCLIEQ
jgi:hypothetical protein